MNRLTVSMMAAALMFGVQSTRAEHEKQIEELRNPNKSTSEIIGRKVTNAQDEDLGKIQDIIVNVEAGTAPYAVIAQGGVFGPNRCRIAVPLSALQCSEDGKRLMMSA